MSLDRLMLMHENTFVKRLEKDKLHSRIIIKCLICEKYDDAARMSSGNKKTVPYANGVRTEGRTGTMRLIDHLLGNPHSAALNAKKLHEQFISQNDKHPWLSILKTHRDEVVQCLIRLAMDVYNNTLCETVSGYSWPSRSLTSDFGNKLVRQFAEEWDSEFQSFEPSGYLLQYRSPEAYYEMLTCIAEDLKSKIYSELEDCDVFGIRIDGSSDRQQWGIKFLTVRIVKNKSSVIRFLSAVEPKKQRCRWSP